MKIFTSASRLVFLLIAVSACIAFFLGRLTESNFMILASSAFAFYFGKPKTQDLATQ